LLARTNTLDADFSPDGSRLAFAGADGWAQILEANTGAPVISPFRYSGSLWGIRFHPDGRRLATASVENIVRLWALTPPESGNLS
jgi:WD40 repeat protein